ncbi:uncharacterized protein LOC110053136 [Orbicella faveolata]|uniref:uncharacterized protein LOC110053136 n=1 Tax=Orbicella faveolata TaxID=48498 RepID=UPI0009E2C265|nr:uncharacterized protein LOC110053136 [Orbicella faveolata]
MYVYGLHTSGPDYVTDELWAAFYKKLLEERLVPIIVLSNESPGFDWIKKFVQPENVHPCTWTEWELHRGIVPPEEDYFDYLAVDAALCPVSRQFLTLTREDVGKFQFRDFKDVNVVEQRRRQANEIADKLKDSRQLQQELRSLHSDEELIEKLARKLQFAVKETVKLIVNGERPTTETILKNKLIDKKKLALNECEKCKENIKKCKCKSNEPLASLEEYAAVVLRVCQSVDV